MKFLKSIPSLILTAAILLAASPSASAAADVNANATIVVNTATDDNAVNGLCSLREAIIAANTNAAFQGCSAGSGTDTITFAANYTITLGSQLPAVTSPIVINGNGAGNTIIQANGTADTATYRVFQVSNTGNLTLNGLTVRHGRCTDSCEGNINSGGGILNGGTLTVTNSTLSGNFAEFGGGISNSGTLTVTNSTLSGNSATNGHGGGILNGSTLTVTNSTLSDNSATLSGGGFFNYGTLTLTNSTLYHNSAEFGGGIHNSNTLTVTNSTLSTNTSSAIGGGILNLGKTTVTNSTFYLNIAETDGGGFYNDGDGSLTVTNSTFANNGAVGNGGGIYSTGSMSLINTIITGIIGGGDCFQDPFVPLTNPRNNLIGNVSSACGLINGVNGNIIGQDPMLDTLANNGGFTQTHALLTGSPAIDKGNATICKASPVNNKDQRGVSRNQGLRCDIGAYEYIFDKGMFKSNATQDGWILESSETSGVGGTLNNTATTLNLGDDAANRQYRAILSFNTSSLPDDAVIVKVTLKVKRQGVTGGGNPINFFGGFKVDIKKGNFGNAGLQLTDFNHNTGVQTLAQDYKPGISNGWYTINITAGKGKINKTGNTQIRLRFKLDDNNNNVANFLSLHSGDARPVNRPQLIVEYYVP
jgi:CSLREA domain-containing protein